MRSVVVILPASMCAMMPMLRSLARPASAAATVFPSLGGSHPLSSPAGTAVPLPAVVREGLIGLGHLVRVLAPLDGGAKTVARVEQLVHESLDHGLLATGAGVLHQPPQAQRD